MKKVANVLIAIVAIEHLLFLVLEMFLWTSPTGMRVFGTTPEFAANSAVLAANQGLYNGFLAAGLIWSLLRKDNADSIKIFFLACVVIAGVFGGLTAKASILFVQGMPALAALLLVIFNQRKAS
jgi:putative membrane protein